MVLQIALNDHKIDGLTPSAIAKILSDKFRISTKISAVQMALSRATKLVDRIPTEKGFLYRIMGPGDNYLAHLGEEQQTTSITTKRVKNGSRAFKKPSTKTDIGKKTLQPKAEKKLPRVQGKVSQSKGAVGPKSAIIELLNSGFFSEGKTAPEVQTHVRNKRGFNFGMDQIRLAMLRLVRDKMLDRNPNKEGQYEYKKPII
jgi:hypothetical protein